MSFWTLILIALKFGAGWWWVARWQPSPDT
jgi:hypothetical protein